MASEMQRSKKRKHVKSKICCVKKLLPIENIILRTIRKHRNKTQIIMHKCLMMLQKQATFLVLRLSVFNIFFFLSFIFSETEIFLYFLSRTNLILKVDFSVYRFDFHNKLIVLSSLFLWGFSILGFFNVEYWHFPEI